MTQVSSTNYLPPQEANLLARSIGASYLSLANPGFSLPPTRDFKWRNFCQIDDYSSHELAVQDPSSGVQVVDEDEFDDHVTVDDQVSALFHDAPERLMNNLWTDSDLDRLVRKRQVKRAAGDIEEGDETTSSTNNTTTQPKTGQDTNSDRTVVKHAKPQFTNLVLLAAQALLAVYQAKHNEDMQMRKLPSLYEVLTSDPRNVQTSYGMWLLEYAQQLLDRFGTDMERSPDQVCLCKCSDIVASCEY